VSVDNILNNGVMDVMAISARAPITKIRIGEIVIH
jgi:hypothetical protein